MNIEEFVKDLDPVTLVKFKNYLSEHLLEFFSKKNSNYKIVFDFNEKRLACDICGGKLNKNGKTKHEIQKYICSCCNKSYSETTDTVIYHSKLPFSTWANIINNLIDGFSIRRIAEDNNISVQTSFMIRHKILNALNTFIDKIELNDNTQTDEKYFSINLKGTKPNNMPRYSKKRTSSSGNSLKGLNHHKVCVISSIDEHNNLILKIAGLSKCNTKMIENVLGNKVKNVSSMNTDSATAYESFCFNHGIVLHSIPSGAHSIGSININTINGIHSQLDSWLSKFRGVSIRHLQGYLNWFNYIFTMKKRFNLANLKIESYYHLIIDNNYIKSNDIFKIDMPIDLNIAYAEYNYQS